MSDPNDGLGWYILEGDDIKHWRTEEQVLKHAMRYNLRESAKSMAEFLFPNQTFKLGFWTGAVWEKVELP